MPAAPTTLQRKPPRPRSAGEKLTLPGGGHAVLAEDGDAIELRDAAGKLLVRYDGDTTEVSAPAGDLRLSAPYGRVVVEAASDVVLSAGRDAVHRAARAVELATGPLGASPSAHVRLERDTLYAKAGRADLVANALLATAAQAEVVAKRLATTAREAAFTAERYEAAVESWVQRSRESLREVAELAEERLGRVRAVVKETFSLESRRAQIRSEEETSIDGKRVLLG